MNVAAKPIIRYVSRYVSYVMWNGILRRSIICDSSMLKSKNQVTLFINYSYNSFYDFRYSENTYSEQKVMCQNMGFLILYGGYIWTYF